MSSFAPIPSQLPGEPESSWNVPSLPQPIPQEARPPTALIVIHNSNNPYCVLSIHEKKLFLEDIISPIQKGSGAIFEDVAHWTDWAQSFEKLGRSCPRLIAALSQPAELHWMLTAAQICACPAQPLALKMPGNPQRWSGFIYPAQPKRESMPSSLRKELYPIIEWQKNPQADSICSPLLTILNQNITLNQN